MSRHFSLMACCVALLASAFGCSNRAEPTESPIPLPEHRTSRVVGKVVWKGAVPAETTIDISADEQITRARNGRPLRTENWVVGESGGLANVFVYLDRKPETRIPAAPTEPVVIRVEGGAFVPHAVGLRAGQTLHFELPALESHNPHFSCKQSFPGSERMRRADELDYKFNTKEIFPVKCDIHGWMRGLVGVFDHPWFAVTGLDGRFEFPALPPGRYRIKAWHENGGEKELEVELRSDTD